MIQRNKDKLYFLVNNQLKDPLHQEDMTQIHLFLKIAKDLYKILLINQPNNLILSMIQALNFTIRIIENHHQSSKFMTDCYLKWNVI